MIVGRDTGRASGFVEAPWRAGLASKWASLTKQGAVITRDSSASSSSGGFVRVERHNALLDRGDVNGLPINPSNVPKGVDPSPPPPLQLGPAAQLVSGSLFGKKLRKAKVAIGEDVEEVWIDGTNGPLWIRSDGRVYRGYNDVGKWGFELGQHGHGRHWSDMTTTDRKTCLCVAGKHQHEVRLQMNVTVEELSGHIKSTVEANPRDGQQVW